MMSIYVVLYEGFVGAEQGMLFFVKTLGLLVPALFLMDFIVKRNKLVQTHAYTLLFFVIFTGIFTAVFTNTELLLSHFFVLMGLRRVISLKNKGRTRKKIFEASLWFLVASFFYDWALLYFLVLMLGVVFHLRNSFVYWGLMLWATAVYALLLKAFVIGSHTEVFFEQHYLFEHAASVSDKMGVETGLFFGSSLLVLLWVNTKNRRAKNPSLGRQQSLRVLFMTALVGMSLFFIFPEPSLAPLIFTFFPMAFLWSNATEELRKTWHKELLLWSAFSIPLWGLLAYLIQN